jgi:hypothetical protein
MKTTTFITAAMLMATAGIASAATVTWNTFGIVDYNDVNTNGNLIGAYTFVTGGASSTVNGVTFTGLTTNVTDTIGDITIATTGGTGAVAAGNYTPSTSVGTAVEIMRASTNVNDIAYFGLLGNGLKSTNNGTITCNFSGLTAGYTYEVQFWTNYTGASSPARTATFSDGTNSITAQVNIDNTAGSFGQYTVGSFTAGDDGLQTITIKSDTAALIPINAFQLRQTASPEPSTYALFGGLAVAGIAFVTRRRKNS